MKRSHVVVLLVCALAVAVAGDTKPTVMTKTIKSEDGNVIGVASVGYTTRNGRVSSVSGVKFFPGSQEPFFYTLPKSGDKLPSPISFSKEENGKYTAGTINISPGSVSVSSIARSSLPGDTTSKNSEEASKLKASIDDMFFPIPNFNPRSFDPWFNNNFQYRQPIPFRYSPLRNNWPYPGYSPFVGYW